jgi:hypothetical protein
MRELLLLSVLAVFGCSRSNEAESFRLLNVKPPLPPQHGSVSYNVSYECRSVGLELVLEVDGLEYDRHELQPSEEAQQHDLVAKPLSAGEHRTEILLRYGSGKPKSLSTGVVLVP